MLQFDAFAQCKSLTDDIKWTFYKQFNCNMLPLASLKNLNNQNFNQEIFAQYFSSRMNHFTLEHSIIKCNGN